ncbi:MAG: NDP-sugar synthase [Candidatus Eremiobacteraeota bacterium]|nr:NDP-sugar synthase [Candidatus Eremiobacteraeota bacterium]
MKAMILAGGMSTRLYPLTKQVPKPLVPVAGEPNAVHLIRYLANCGFDEIAINVHYLADKIVLRLGDGSRFGVRLEYLHEERLLGSAGAVQQMQAFFGDAPFVVVGCDDLTDLPLTELLAFHRRSDAIATIGLVRRDAVDQYGVVVTQADGRIVGFQEKPARGTEQSNLVNTGIYAFSPEIFRYIPAGAFYDFGRDVFPALQRAAAAFYGFDARGSYWCDIGTPEEYRRATFDVLNGVFAIPQTRSHGIDSTAAISSRAEITGTVWIGANAVVADNVIIDGPAVIGDDVRIDAGATISRSILWDGARIGCGAALRNSIVGIDYAVAPGAELQDRIVANEPVQA